MVRSELSPQGTALLKRRKMKRLIIASILLLLMAVAVSAEGPGLEPPASSPEPVTNITYLPLVERQYQAPHTSDKKCVAISRFLEREILGVGAGCTYQYSPIATYNTSIPYSGMLVIGQPLATNGTSPYFLGWNEPDLSNYLTPDAAAAMTPTAIEANPGKLMVGPGISQLGLDWLKQYLTSYRDRFGGPAPLAALSVHCYLDTARQCEALVQEVIDLGKTNNIPSVWVTEFAFWRGSTPEVETRQFVAWMETNPMIGRYFWWAASYKGDEPWAVGFVTQLYDWVTGELTQAGRVYRDLP